MTRTDLHTLDFVFDSSDVPTSRLFLEEAAAPGVSVEESRSSRFMRRRRRRRGLSNDSMSPAAYGDVTYEDLDISFVVDNDLKNWREIFDWIQTNLQGGGSGGDEEGMRATGTIILVTPKGGPSLKLTFHGMFPTSLSEVEFDATEDDPEDVSVKATFAYSHYEIDKV